MGAAAGTGGAGVREWVGGLTGCAGANLALYNAFMKLPSVEQAAVKREKITDYLLSDSHPNGRHKARFFAAFGFSMAAWQELANALLRQAMEHDVAKAESSPFGTRYVIDGKLFSPDNRNPMVRTMWFVESSDATPYFVTAYPLEEKQA